MRKSFFEYYPLSDDQYKQLGENALVVFDANALLHAYRLPLEASNQWLKLIEALKGRLWLPHQAALEYQQNRISVLTGYKSLEVELEDLVQETISKLKKQSHLIKRTRGMNWHEINEVADRFASDLRQLIGNASHSAVDLDDAVDAKDDIHERLSAVFEDSIGDEPNEDWLNEIYKQGKERYQLKIPPGWRDNSKDGNRRKYGDLIVWSQLLEYASENNHAVVLVSEDRKEDWVRKQAGRTFGPLPDLRREFEEQVHQPFWMYTVYGFMSKAKDYGVSLNQSAIELAEEIEQDKEEEETSDVGIVDIESLVSALERFEDQESMPDETLRQEILELLSGWLTQHLEKTRQQLRGPGVE